MGEFVSGNYFRTFGLRPQAGRLLMDRTSGGRADDGGDELRDVAEELCRRSSVVGSTFWVNTKPVTVVGIAPKGFFGDRLSSTPPEFYLPIESMPLLANVPYVHDRDGIGFTSSGG